jgi:putative membrane protein
MHILEGNGQKMLTTRYLRIYASVLAGSIALAACEDRGAGPGDTGIALETKPAALGPRPAVGPSPILSDANILYLLDAANRADSAAGTLAATKGTSSDVRQFGTRMAREHHALRTEAQTLVTRVGITPTPPEGDTTQAMIARAMARLNGAAKGRDFDKAYMDREVAYHKTQLEALIAAMNGAQSAELKNLIQKAAPVVQSHLDLAQSIQAALR